MVQMFEPYVSMASQMGVGDILYAASERGPTVYTTFLASRDSIRRNRAAFAAMVRATRRMLAWLAEHSAEELADAVAQFYPDVPRDILVRSLRVIGMRACGPTLLKYRGRALHDLPLA